MTRPGIVTLLAVLQFLGGGFWLLVALFVGAAGLGADGGAGAVVGAAIVASIGGLQFLCGIGLWQLKHYGRTMQIVFACIGLLLIPAGTLIGIVVILYMRKPGIRALFSGTPPSALSPDELASIAVDARYSTGMVIAIAVVGLFLAVVTVSIIAAIAVPGLLRARMAANETAAISRLVEIGNAEAAYSAGCGNGGYAYSFAMLAAADPKTTAVSSPEIARLAGSVPGGYQYTLRASVSAGDGPVDCHGLKTRTAWVATAVPGVFGGSGSRSFAITGDAVVWQVPAATPPTEPFGPPASPVKR
jgi:type IV pilus assembly protein PilA